MAIRAIRRWRPWSRGPKPALSVAGAGRVGAVPKKWPKRRGSGRPSIFLAPLRRRKRKRVSSGGRRCVRAGREGAG